MGTSFWVIAIAILLLSLGIIFYSIIHSKSRYDKWQKVVVVLFGISLCATGYVLFSPVTGLYDNTLSLWQYWTNDQLKFLSFLASKEVADGLAMRKTLIWPCFIADALCIYAYIKLGKKDE